MQCISYYDSGSAGFLGRQRAWNAWIITSRDGGVTWNKSATDVNFFAGTLTNPVFIQAGRGHAAAPDGYVYIHFPAAHDPDTAYWDSNDFILLGRVRPANILDRSSYEFWTGSTTATGINNGRSGAWSSDAADAAPHFQYKHMTGQVHTFYNVGLQRYIIPNYGFMDPETGAAVSWHGYHKTSGGAVVTAQLTLYESRTPMGPWSLFYTKQPWVLHGPTGAYCPDFPSQYQSADGTKLRVVYSACCGQPEYAYHMAEVELALGAG